MELELWEEEPESKNVVIDGSGGRTVVAFGDCLFIAFILSEPVVEYGVGADELLMLILWNFAGGSRCVLGQY